MQDYKNKIKTAAEYIKAKTNLVPEIGMVLGTGLGQLADEIENAVSIPYSEIPGFVVSTAPSHAGRLVIGTLSGKTVMAMQGRVHLYEGYTPKDVTLPIRVMKELGAQTLITTCAAGGLNRNFTAGSFMLIKDHLNMMGTNTLTGPNDSELGVRFPVMFDAYTPSLRALAKQVATDNKIYVHEGVYYGIAGPVFTTRAEARLAMQSGADAVGMSVVQEVITASHANMKVLGIASITDMALPDLEHHASEEEIIQIANKSTPVFKTLVKEILNSMHLN